MPAANNGMDLARLFFGMDQDQRDRQKRDEAFSYQQQQDKLQNDQRTQQMNRSARADYLNLISKGVQPDAAAALLGMGRPESDVQMSAAQELAGKVAEDEAYKRQYDELEQKMRLYRTLPTENMNPTAARGLYGSAVPQDLMQGMEQAYQQRQAEAGAEKDYKQGYLKLQEGRLTLD